MDINTALTTAVTKSGQAFTIDSFIHDLRGNITSIKGTITILIPGSSAEIKEVYWNVNGKCLGFNHSNYDLVMVKPFVKP